MVETSAVNWSSYAEVYDLMAFYNPAYRDLVEQFRNIIAQWHIASQSTLAELGAGTGNFSTELAYAFPMCQIVHLDSDARMNRCAESKAVGQNLQNMRFITEDIQQINFQSNSLSAVVMVHALYSFPNPQAVISKIFDWLIAGGYLFACDAGSEAKVSDWIIYLFSEWVQRYGLWRTLQLFYKGRIVTQQNRRIAKAQKAGVYWMHTAAEFRSAFESCGFEIITEQKTYRNTSNLILARKPIGR